MVGEREGRGAGAGFGERAGGLGGAALAAEQYRVGEPQELAVPGEFGGGYGGGPVEGGAVPATLDHFQQRVQAVPAGQVEHAGVFLLPGQSGGEFGAGAGAVLGEQGADGPAQSVAQRRQEGLLAAGLAEPGEFAFHLAGAAEVRGEGGGGEQ